MDTNRYNREASGDSAPVFGQEPDVYGNDEGAYVAPATPTVVVEEPAQPAGKKRAGYTTNKGKGTPKAKHRMAVASRRANWRRGR